MKLTHAGPASPFFYPSFYCDEAGEKRELVASPVEHPSRTLFLLTIERKRVSFSR